MRHVVAMELMATDQRAHRALERIYELFAAPTPSRIEGCPCCVGTRRVDLLLTTPLRDLTGQILWRYVTGVFLTVGSDRDFRYLLPRILELAVCDPASVPDVEIILGKLRLAGWATWAPAERQAIEALIDPWFEAALARDLLYAEEWQVGSDAESLLCGIGRADLDLSPWLVRLAAPEATPVRASIAERYAKYLMTSELPEASFWEDAPIGWRSLANVVGK